MEDQTQEIGLTQLHISKEELDTALWKKLEAHFKNKLDITRKQNDYINDEGLTNRLRGRISAYKEFLQLDPDSEDI